MKNKIIGRCFECGFELADHDAEFCGLCGVITCKSYVCEYYHHERKEDYFILHNNDYSKLSPGYKLNKNQEIIRYPNLYYEIIIPENHKLYLHLKFENNKTAQKYIKKVLSNVYDIISINRIQRSYYTTNRNFMI